MNCRTRWRNIRLSTGSSGSSSIVRLEITETSSVVTASSMASATAMPMDGKRSRPHNQIGNQSGDRQAGLEDEAIQGLAAQRPIQRARGKTRAALNQQKTDL
jgi:hypothetical protein